MSYGNHSLIDGLYDPQTFSSYLLCTHSVLLPHAQLFTAKGKFRITLLRGLICNNYFLLIHLLTSTLFLATDA